MPPGPRPRLVYDGDCGFCKRAAVRMRHWTGPGVEFAPAQRVAAEHPDVPPQEFLKSVWLFEPDGRRSRAAEACLRALARHPAWGWLLWLYRWIPGVRPAAEWGYRCIAGHRPAFLRLDRALTGDALVPRYQRSRRIVLAGFGLTALIAFASLGVQVLGLVGSHGILPASERMQQARAVLGPGGWLQMPTLCWWSTSDLFLQLLCGIGAAAALLLILDFAPALACGVIYVCYLSLLHACFEFLAFQWDILLLETALCAVLFAPWRLGRGRGADPPPPAAARWLLWWLLFRLVFESGVVKLSWGDSHWLDFTALDYHYWTQPLPHRGSVLAASLPEWCQRASLGGVYAIELGAPIFIWAPRRLRHAAAGAIALLSLLIALTGNYGFFNLLTLVLCGALLDDQAWDALRPRRWRRSAAAQARAVAPVDTSCGLGPGEGWELPPPAAEARARWPQRALLAPFAAFALLVGVGQVLEALRGNTSAEPGWFGRTVQALEQPVAGFVPVNSYGLFRVMTTERPELVFEGSADGQTWLPYEFPWYPGDPAAAPRWQQPHMPRLDWRMWFAALSPRSEAGWLLPFAQKLLANEPAVLALMARNPFPDAPPQFVRVLLYQYRFSSAAERAASGAWWQRELQSEILRLPLR